MTGFYTKTFVLPFFRILIYLLALYIPVAQTICAQGLATFSYGTDQSFDVVTWNIEWFPKNNQTLDSVKVAIEAMQPDVLALQEIDETDVFNQLLDELDGYEGFYLPVNMRGLAYIYNPATVELLDSYYIYENMQRPFPRAPLVAEVRFGGQEFVLINNHFKCCGNGLLNTGDLDDEENRRKQAVELIDEYIRFAFDDKNVIVLGDFNDSLLDDEQHNVFNDFFEASDEYAFADLAVAEGSSANWSFPSFPSHLDHILISNELFDEFAQTGASCETLRLDDVMAGFWQFDNLVSDHRPVGLRLPIAPIFTSVEPVAAGRLHYWPNPGSDVLQVEFETSEAAKTLRIFDLEGRLVAEHAWQGQRYELATTDLPIGTYLLQFLNEGKPVATKKWVKVE